MWVYILIQSEFPVAGEVLLIGDEATETWRKDRILGVYLDRRFAEETAERIRLAMIESLEANRFRYRIETHLLNNDEM